VCLLDYLVRRDCDFLLHFILFRCHNFLRRILLTSWSILVKLWRLLRVLTCQLPNYASNLLLLSSPIQVLRPHGYLVEVPKRDIAPEHPLATPSSVGSKCDLSGSLLVHVVRPESDLLALVDLHVLREVVKSLKGNLSSAQDEVSEGLEARLVRGRLQIDIFDCQEVQVALRVAFKSDDSTENALLLPPLPVQLQSDCAGPLLDDVVHWYHNLFALVLYKVLTESPEVRALLSVRIIFDDVKMCLDPCLLGWGARSHLHYPVA
jgi:hypothetical protein